MACDDLVYINRMLYVEILNEIFNEHLTMFFFYFNDLKSKSVLMK